MLWGGERGGGWSGEALLARSHVGAIAMMGSETHIVRAHLSELLSSFL